MRINKTGPCYRAGFIFFLAVKLFGWLGASVGYAWWRGP